MKKFIIFMFTLSIAFLIYNEYPRSGSFSDLILNKYYENQFIEIQMEKDYKHKVCNDPEKINEFLKYLGNIKIIEYKGKMPHENVDIYDIGIYDNKEVVIGITIENASFIHVFISHEQISKNYKILNNSLDMKYIQDFYNFCKTM